MGEESYRSNPDKMTPIWSHEFQRGVCDALRIEVVEDDGESVKLFLLRKSSDRGGYIWVSLLAHEEEGRWVVKDRFFTYRRGLVCDSVVLNVLSSLETYGKYRGTESRELTIEDILGF